MIGQFLLRGGDDQLVHGPCLDQHHLVVVVNSGQELFELLDGRRVGACDGKGDFSNLVHNAPADGLVDRIPGGKESVDVRRAHAEFGGDVGHRRLVMADPAEVLLRHLQDARARLVAVCSHSDNRALLSSHCCSQFQFLR